MWQIHWGLPSTECGPWPTRLRGPVLVLPWWVRGDEFPVVYQSKELSE